jgi:hypothetical protein
MCVALSNVNPEEAQKVAMELMEEVAPYLKFERKKKDAKMSSSLVEEVGKTYRVTSAAASRSKRAFKLSKKHGRKRRRR